MLSLKVDDKSKTHLFSTNKLTFVGDTCFQNYEKFSRDFKRFLKGKPLLDSMEEEQKEQVIVPEPILLEPIQLNRFLATPELVQEWKKHYLKEGHTLASTTTYYNYIKGFVGFDGIEITQKTIDKFRFKSPCGACAGALKNFIHFLVRKKEFPTELFSIYFDKSKSKKKMPESFEPIEVEKIIESMEQLKDKYLTVFLANFGLRINEALKLRFEDLNWATWLQDRSQKGSMKLKLTKGDKYRTLPVSPELMEFLYSDAVQPVKTLEGIPAPRLVFDYGYNNYVSRKEFTLQENQYAYLQYASDRYRDLLDKVTKAKIGKKCHPHMFRHYKAQQLLNKGLGLIHLKSYLGHATLASTEKYIDSSSELLSKELDKIEPKVELPAPTTILQGDFTKNILVEVKPGLLLPPDLPKEENE